MSLFKPDEELVWHHGIYKRPSSMWSAVFIMVGMSIGAGILGLPYAIAQVGLKMGIVYILVLGVAMMFLNLMVGEIAVRTKEPFQLPGFAGKYLGNWARDIVSLAVIFGGVGALLAYIVGEGQTLSALFGGDPFWWSIMFWVIGSFIVWRGLEIVKTVERASSIAGLVLVIGLSIYLLSGGDWTLGSHTNFSNIFLPYGIILFALYAAPAVAESHALLPNDPGKFRKAIVIGTIIPVVVYLIFVSAVVVTTGLNTTPIATLGLGQMLGNKVLYIGNLFAALAMFTAFMVSGIALKQTFLWDFKIRSWLSQLLVVTVPVVLFLIGFNNFIEILDVVGGVFIGIEAIFMVLVYWQAKRKGDLISSQYNLHNFWLLAVPVFLVFTFMTIYSIIKMF